VSTSAAIAVDRVLAGTTTGHSMSLVEHHRAHGPMPRLSGRDLLSHLQHAGLTGRGGAGFPVATKIATVAQASGGPKVVIANGAESEPMSAKDRVVMELAPHLVLDGLEIAAELVGARQSYIVVGASADAAWASVTAALRDRGRRAPKAVRLPSHYLAGQETAMINHIAGRPLKPTVIPPLPAQRGLRGRPTLVQNVETLAHLALIARHGAHWFRSVGTERSPGTILATLSGAVAQPGVYEVHGGAAVTDLLALAGGTTEAPQAMLIGGYFGTWFDSLGLGKHLDTTRLARHNATIGTGAVVILGESACPVAEVARTTSWLASQSAGQCGPCSNGLPAIAHALDAMASGRSDRNDVKRIARWAQLVQGRGACHHPDGVARFVVSALEVFKDEFRTHARRGPCQACRRPGTLIVPAQALGRAA
jgi:NADH:ubiquinone oxidoreductase subunit F (NADH-binding)